jgi:hypothetical protein
MNNIRNHFVFGKNIYTCRSRKPGGGGVLNIIQGQGELIFMSFLLAAILVPAIRRDADKCPASFCKYGVKIYGIHGRWSVN